jgi:hypothetical protein
MAATSFEGLARRLILERDLFAPVPSFALFPRGRYRRTLNSWSAFSCRTRTLTSSSSWRSRECPPPSSARSGINGGRGRKAEIQLLTSALLLYSVRSARRHGNGWLPPLALISSPTTSTSSASCCWRRTRWPDQWRGTSGAVFPVVAKGSESACGRAWGVALGCAGPFPRRAG